MVGAGEVELQAARMSHGQKFCYSQVAPEKGPYVRSYMTPLRSFDHGSTEGAVTAVPILPWQLSSDLGDASSA